MPLEREQRKQLQAALLSSFDNDGLHRLARFELGSDLELFTTGGDRRQQVFELIAWAERTDRTAELVCGAYNQNPTNVDLQRFIRAAQSWPACSAHGLTIWDGEACVFAPREVEEAYLEGLVTKFKEWEQRYTPLAGTATVEDSKGRGLSVVVPEFMPTGFEKLVEHGYGPEKRIERVPISDLREAVTAYRRLVVLGEPGSGKTTTLWRLVYDYAAAATGDISVPLPLLVPLGGYTGSESILTYCAQFAGELGLHLPAYLTKGRLIVLLDAMNEMPRDGYTERLGRIQALIERFPELPVVVTCRTLDYSEDLKLEKVDVKPLDVFRQREYLHRYLGRVAGDKLFWQLAGGDAVADLWEAWQRRGMTFEQLLTIKELPNDLRWSLSSPQHNDWAWLRRDGLPPLLALGVNPFLLVMFAQVSASKGELPQNRGKLFAAFVDTLLERERVRHPDGWPGAEVLIEACAILAFAMQQSGKRGTAVERDWAEKGLYEGGFAPGRVLYLAASATLLDMSGGQVRFVHQLIQEYFAAVAWQGRIRLGDNLHQYWRDGWEETAVLLAGMLPDMTAFVEQLLMVNPPLAARCIAESGGVWPTPATIGRVQTALVEIAFGLTAPVVERNAAGNALNYLGDPRDGTGVKDGVPEIAWCKVPAGEFLMGTPIPAELTERFKEYDSKYLEHKAKAAKKSVLALLLGGEGPTFLSSNDYVFTNEMPLHSRHLAQYEISRYPITNAQFRAFVMDGGYTERWQQCWTDAGWEWREKNHIVRPEQYGGDFGLDNHPAIGVSWFEAVAFCRWLTANIGKVVELPSEAQWEKAARGVDGQRYPWGAVYSAENANCGEAHVGCTTSVGVFPAGSTPYNLLDASGNVFEWTSKIYIDQYAEYDPDDDLDSEGGRTVRGGSWQWDRFESTCTFRIPYPPSWRANDVGFRVVCNGQ